MLLEMRGAVLCLSILLLACGGGARAEGANSAQAESLGDARRKVAAIELCKSREQELLTSFGESMREGRVGKLRIRSWLLSKDHLERILAVALDERGTVVDISWDAPGTVTWIPRDQCAAAER
jgi:hypothetical protein